MVATGYPKKAMEVAKESMSNDGIKVERKYPSGLNVSVQREGLKLHIDVHEPKGKFMYELPVGSYHREKRIYSRWFAEQRVFFSAFLIVKNNFFYIKYIFRYLIFLYVKF